MFENKIRRMNNNFVIILILVVIFFLQSCQDLEEKLTRPNIIWITTEDISPQLGCYGDSYAHTPILDKLAAEGILYENAIASAPVCAAARSSIITGMHQSSLGSQHMRSKGEFPKEFKYYPQYLKVAGYYVTNNSKEDYNLNYDSSKIWDESSKVAHWRTRENKNQPFFSVFNFTGTHESATNSKEKHESIIKDLDKNVFIEPGVAPLPPYYPDTPIVHELWARYYNNIAALDKYVAIILEQLKEDGLEDNTIIMFYSDHGAGIPFYKRWLYDSGLKVPLIVKMPEKYQHLSPHKKGTKTDELVSFTDLAPTVLSLSNVEIPKHMQGRSFLGKNLSKERDYVYASRDRMDERYDMQRAVRSKKYKYIRYYEFAKPFVQYMNTPEKGDIMKAIRISNTNGNLPDAGKKLMAISKPVEELFDIKNDPFELNDLSENTDYQNILNDMRQAHIEWSLDINDTGLIPEPILRSWEQSYNHPIFSIVRNQKIPMAEIQKVALSKDFNVFLNALNHENEVVRYWAATGLGNYPEEVNNQAKIKLRELLIDEVSLVRIAAARALCILDEPSKGLTVLANELNDSSEWNRLNAVLVLDELGDKSKPVIPALKMVMNDKNKYVVRVANHALNTMLDLSNKVK